MRRTKTEIMRGVEHRKSRIIANNTVEYWNGDTKVIRYHLTDVVTVKPNNDIVLNSGGYRTLTTKDRINIALKGVGLYQEKFQWYLVNHGEWDKRIPFYDGIVLPKGKLPRVTKKQLREKRKRDNLIKRISKFCNLLDKRDIPEPNAGDCFLCTMFERTEWKILSDGRLENPDYRSDNVDHLHSHITQRESYLHGSMIVNAFLWAGHTTAVIGYYIAGNQKDHVKRVLRRYLQAQLGVS